MGSMVWLRHKLSQQLECQMTTLNRSPEQWLWQCVWLPGPSGSHTWCASNSSVCTLISLSSSIRSWWPQSRGSLPRSILLKYVSNFLLYTSDCNWSQYIAQIHWPRHVHVVSWRWSRSHQLEVLYQKNGWGLPSSTTTRTSPASRHNPIRCRIGWHG